MFLNIAVASKFCSIFVTKNRPNLVSRLKPCHTSIKYLTDVYEWVLSLQISMVTPLSASTTAATRFPWPVIYICKVCCIWCCGSRSPAIADIMYRFRINAYVYQFSMIYSKFTQRTQAFKLRYFMNDYVETDRTPKVEYSSQRRCSNNERTTPKW